MGHTRLGAVPKTRQWNEVVEQIAGSAAEAGSVAVAAEEITDIASRTLTAAQKALEKATDDSGVQYTFYLLTQMALASRTSDWKQSLSRIGIQLTDESSVFDLTAELQDAVDRHINQAARGKRHAMEEVVRFSGAAPENQPANPLDSFMVFPTWGLQTWCAIICLLWGPSLLSHPLLMDEAPVLDLHRKVPFREMWRVL